MRATMWCAAWTRCVAANSNTETLYRRKTLFSQNRDTHTWCNTHHAGSRHLSVRSASSRAAAMLKYQHSQRALYSLADAPRVAVHDMLRVRMRLTQRLFEAVHRQLAHRHGLDLIALITEKQSQGKH